VPSNLEFALITRVIQDGDFQTLEKLRVNEEFFTSPEAREVFKYVRESFHNVLTFGQVPSFDMVRYRFPSFYFAPANDSVQILAHELKKDRLRLELDALGDQLKAQAQADPLAALAALKSGAISLGAMNDTSSEDLSMSDAFQQLEADYELTANSQGVLGIPFPWAQMTEETQGMQPGQFFIIYGRPKNMKSWVSVLSAVHAYVAARRRVLYVTREMPAIQLARRAASVIARIDYNLFRKGRLQPYDKTRVFQILRDLLDDEKAAGAHGMNQPFLVFTADKSGSSGSGGGVSWIQSKIRDLRPDIVFVDGMYLLRDDRGGQRTVDWKAIAHISQDLKMTASEFNIPLVGVTQANRAAEKGKGDDMSELAYADAFGQDADGVFRVTKHIRRDEQTKEKHTELNITAPGIREGDFEGIIVNAKLSTDFSYIRTIVAQEEDDQQKDGYGEGKKRGGGDRPNGATGTRRNQQFMGPGDPKVPMNVR
jgi:replicative DNA helicase